MSEPRRGWGVFAVLVAAATAMAVLSIPRVAGGGIGVPNGKALALLAATAVAEAAVAALAWAHYRATRDTSSLFLSAGFAALALQTACFGVWWPLTHGTRLGGSTVGTIFSFGPMNLGSGRELAPVYGWQVAWVIAAMLFWLSTPWRDRRGRAPVRASMVFGATAALLVTVDLLLVYAGDPTPPLPDDAFAAVMGTGHLAWSGYAVGLSAIALLLGAASRRWALPRSLPSRPWLTATFLFAIPAQIAVMTHPRANIPSARQADPLQLAVPVLAFAGLLLDQRSESSRMRRASDRATGVMDGRAEIASMIAHEVRGPVATVRGIASTSLTHYGRLTDDEHREFLGMIELESRRLMTTVDQMSLALKIDAGSLRFDRKPQDLADIVRAGVAAVEAGDREVRIEAAPGLTVSADWGRMVEVVRQLLDNAVKYSPADAPIVVTAHREGDDALIEILDRGPGIPAHEREHLFEKFPNWRPPGYEEQPGTGLGLFICRGSVAEHGGRIAIEDGPGGGTMLRVRLPMEG